MRSEAEGNVGWGGRGSEVCGKGVSDLVWIHALRQVALDTGHDRPTEHLSHMTMQGLGEGER